MLELGNAVGLGSVLDNFYRATDNLYSNLEWNSV